jgi:hypothetical protein
MRTFASVMIFGLLPILATPAAAHIACDHEYQIVNGQEIETPYCDDNNLAHVARQHGDRVRARDVRNDPSVKDAVCRFVGDDPRASGACNSPSSDN